jgi:CRP-like cAMP-binding protein
MPHPSSRSALDLFLERLLHRSELSGEEREAVAGLPAVRVEVAAHRDMVRPGERPDHSCLVERGLIGRFGQTETGVRQFVSVHIPGEMADLHSLMVPQANLAINALAPSVVLRVPHQALRDIGLRHPAIAAAFWRDCVLEAAIVAQWLVNVARRGARARLAHFFCEMGLRYRQFGQLPPSRYELPMTQEQLADVAGLTSVHVNRTLMALRDEGIMTISRGVVDILDWKALINAAEFDPAYLDLKNGRLD